MRALRYVYLFIIVFWTIPVGAQNYVPGEVIVRLKSASGSQSAASFLGKANSNKSMTLKRSWGKLNAYHFGVKAGKTVDETINELRNDPDVLYAEPNYYLQKATDFRAERIYNRDQVSNIVQSDPSSAYEGQLGVEQIYQSMKASSFSYKPVVAIIDTGLDVTHPVFVESNALWQNPHEIAGNGIDDDGNGYVDDINGWNFAYHSNNVSDDDGHGTHVAGIVLKAGMDILANPVEEAKVHIMALKFLDSNGVGTTTDAIQAIYYAVNNGAVVLNNSWGGPSYSAALLDVIVFSYNEGVAFVAAAGNSGTNNDSAPMYPASYGVPHIISIAATTNLDYLAYFSNFGKGTVHVGSPGLNIYSTYPGGGYAPMSGTSMASPYAAGIAALMKVAAPDMTGFQIKSGMLAQSDKISQLTNKLVTDGRVNVAHAVAYASGAPIDSSQPGYNPSYLTRELASELSESSGGGCGLVTKLYTEFNRDQVSGGKSTHSGTETWYILVVVALFAVPLALRSYLRSRSPVSRRKFPRYEIATSVSMDIGDKKLIGSVSSISLGGLRVDTDALLDQGGIVTMTIASPDGKDQLQVQGKVVWSESKKSYGLAFSEANDLVLSSIGSWTKGLKKAS
ncbi:MAG: S8 family serine peptidase [Bdellovibrionales bacterium]|nr:S8 family serine peptidase [Bdellovibrionales bacterium]